MPHLESFAELKFKSHTHFFVMRDRDISEGNVLLSNENVASFKRPMGELLQHTKLRGLYDMFP